ncbi:hypothetical protein [Roseateles toxinivorans]|uniref:Uncharacterized protein n=1 Tax=Roseateles toxinivorans TaxID=270368 RepID=A0A4V3CTG1_9BURK|nr:hypothetical protein [Roseateles toxinivorans]TDP71757.1 hypothetical protein DES47_103740 [Roseateles toxinivorans]
MSGAFLQRCLAAASSALNNPSLGLAIQAQLPDHHPALGLAPAPAPMAASTRAPLGAQGAIA